MGKKVKRTKPNFGGMVDDTLTTTEQTGSVDNYEHEHKHEDAQVKRERKTKNLNILTYPSMAARLDAYAKNHDMSRAEVFEVAITKYLNENE